MDASNINMKTLQGAAPGALPVAPGALPGKTSGIAGEDRFEPSVKGPEEPGLRYPLMTEKLFGALDKMEKAVDAMSERPTYKQLSDSQIRNVARWIDVLGEAYEGCYHGNDCEKAREPFQDLAYAIGQYKDADLIESQVKALFPDGKLPVAIQREIGQMKEERAREFHEFFKKFKNRKMDRALEIFREPKSIKGHKSPAEITAKDRHKLSKEAGKLIDRIYETGLFHKNPERLHEGRKSIRDLYAMIYVTGDVFNYQKSDVDSLFSVFTHYGIPQDTSIAQAWLEEKGFTTESKVLKKRMREEQRSAMAEAVTFLDSGVLEHIRETVGS